MKRRYILFFCFLLLHAFSLVAQCENNLLQNGSFDGAKGEDHQAKGWETHGSTPDINDVNGNVNTTSGYHWMGKPLNSRDGGTWQNLYSDREYLEQTVQLKPGTQYTIQFEYASHPIEQDGYRFNSPGGINVYINDQLVFKSSPDKTPFSWEIACYEFTAQMSTNVIRISASVEQYIGIDGICLVEGSACERIP